jgi:hypothetical protein
MTRVQVPHPRSVILRRMARVLLERAEKVRDPKQRRRIDQQAFALVQEALRLQLASDSGTNPDENAAAAAHARRVSRKAPNTDA